jgi:Na+(H+)/acetate symporter ActP
MKGAGLKQEDIHPKDAVKGYIFSLIFSFFGALVLTVFINLMNISGILPGLYLGPAIGIVFGALTIFSNDMNEQLPVKLSFINAGYRTAYLAIIGIILGVWR